MKFLRHVYFSLLGTSAVFSKSDLERIDSLVTEAEAGTSAEICIAVEAALPVADIVKGKSCRERAWEIFSLERIWDTSKNTGILLFISLSERDVEIVVDRGVAEHLDTEKLSAVCTALEGEFKQKRYVAGIAQALGVLHQELLACLPAHPGDRNEIGNRVKLF